MKTYTQLTQEQRYQIWALMKTGQNQTEIAQQLQVHKSTISRELARNLGLRGYRPKQAHHRTVFRRQNKAIHQIDSATWGLIEQQLRIEWSPEQIRAWLKELKVRMVSHESIYQHILKNKHQGGNLYRHLRCQKQREKRYGTYSRRGQIPNRVSIDQRPAIVESRRRLGDWEIDTIIGKGHRQALVSLTERKSRLLRLAKIPFKSAECVTKAVIGLLKPLADRVHTLTSDNGKEFAQHQKISAALNAQFYFAHPYSSWERGLNENTNGLIRQYFPKNTDFRTLTLEDIQEVMDKLNNRPRKSLDFKTPNQVFFNHNHSVALAS